MAINVGIDVSKHSLDWSVGSEGSICHAKNEPRSIAQLTRRLVEIDPERIVVESTGGYERVVVEKLAEAGLPIIVVIPRRVRSFGEGVGSLAKTDAIDARLLALFGEKAQPPFRPIPQGTDRLLADLVARRRQIVSIIVAEKNRRDTASRVVRRTIDPWSEHSPSWFAISSDRSTPCCTKMQNAPNSSNYSRPSPVSVQAWPARC